MRWCNRRAPNVIRRSPNVTRRSPSLIACAICSANCSVRSSAGARRSSIPISCVWRSKISSKPSPPRKPNTTRRTRRLQACGPRNAASIAVRFLSKRDGGDLWRSLRRRGTRYNKRAGKNAGRGLIPNRSDISERPAIVARKTRLGDWEGDTVVSAGRKGGLLTLVERKTKLTKIAKLPRATARATQKAAVRRLKPIADFVHTITFDNGKEFATHQDIAHALKATIFFATPYHAWERGLNENTNGLIRDFFPKATDFSTIANAQVAKVERLLNARPRKSLGFRSPQEVFHSLAYS